MPDSALADGGQMSAQILLKLGELATSIAVIQKTLESVPDHESRLRALERFRFTLAGAMVLLQVLLGIAEWAIIHQLR